jgi:hypothetical protein
MVFSLAIQTLCAELLQLVEDQRGPAGTVYQQRKNGQAFYYYKRTVGRLRLDSYIGPAGDPAAKRLADAIRFQRRTLVSALRRAGIPAPGMALGRVLDVLADAGLLDTAVLVGTAAYTCYPLLLGTPLPSATLMTQDADLATATLALAARDGTSSMRDILGRADPSFREVPGLKPTSPPASFRSGEGFRVDLLTPVLRRNDPNPMPLAHLAAGATPLQYLRWLIQDPVTGVALAGPGIRVRLPQPARFAVHKLIVAQKRSQGERLKRQKDLLQAHALFMALGTTDPDSLPQALRAARRQGKAGWGDPIDKSLAEIGLK